MERAKGFEPSTSCLGSRHSTTELRPRLTLLYDGGAGGVKLEGGLASGWGLSLVKVRLRRIEGSSEKLYYLKRPIA